MSQEIQGCCCVCFVKAYHATPETSPGFADVEMGASAAGDTVHKIFRSAGEMIADGEGAFRAPYIGERSDELAGLSPGAMTCM